MSSSSNRSSSNSSNDGTIINNSTTTDSISSSNTKQQQRTIPPPPTSSKLPQWRDAVAGAGAGTISRTIMAPIERIKLLQQLQYSAMNTSINSSTTSSSGKSTPVRVNNNNYNDIHKLTGIQIALKIYQEEGIKSFLSNKQKPTWESSTSSSKEK